MAGTDEGGLRVGPYVPESGLEPTDGSTESAVTEIIPTVPGDAGGAEETAKVRGRARRSAAALPALGREDGPAKVPRSSRSTLDRRDREQKAAGGERARVTTSQDAGPAPSAGVEREPRPAPVNPFAGQPPRPRRPSDEARPRDGGQWPGAAPWPEVQPAPSVERTDGPTPPARAKEASTPAAAATPMAAPRPPDMPPGPAAIDDTAEFEMASGPASPGLRSRATKERATREGGAPGAPGPARAKRAPTNTDESDRWDKEPTGDLANDTYQGRRRAPRRALRVALVGSIAVLLVGAMFGLPYLLRSSPHGPPGDLADPGTQPAVVVPVPTSTSDEGEISSTAGPAASATPTRTAVRTPTPTSGLAPAEAPTTEPTTAPPTTVAVFQPLTIEAEAGGNSVVSPAERASFDGTSGGQMVGFLGITQGRSGQGRLVVQGITAPTTGTYTVTFQYIASSNRTAHIFVNGNLAGTVAVSARSNCCGTGSLNVTLQQGANTIEFTNPGARCPAIDRIVITRP